MAFHYADGDVMLPKHLHIGVTAVLYAAIGMVDQSLQACAAPHRHGLADGLLRACMVMAVRRDLARPHPIIVCE